jgi:hypothetical protein
MLMETSGFKKESDGRREMQFAVHVKWLRRGVGRR